MREEERAGDGVSLGSARPHLVRSEEEDGFLKVAPLLALRGALICQHTLRHLHPRKDLSVRRVIRGVRFGNDDPSILVGSGQGKLSC